MRDLPCVCVCVFWVE